MSYQALYRTWRPQTFSDLVGQPHVKQTLQNAIARERVAHAYLFCGPRGTGKTSAAKILAKAVNCQRPQGVEPCNECDACMEITNGLAVDVEEIDAASNRGVEEIRQLRDKVQYAPASLRRKVYIVDEVHMLTPEAFNALLKTLEEPPNHTLFVLATTEPHKIPATIVSRCQRFDFRRIEPGLIVERIRQVSVHNDWSYDEEALWKIAMSADGGLRDALGLLEQTAAYGEGVVTAENAAHIVGGLQSKALLSLVQALVEKDYLQVLELVTSWYEAGKDAARILHDFLQVLRDLFVVKLSSPALAAEARFQDYGPVAAMCNVDWLVTAVRQLGETYMNLRFIDEPRLALETALLSVTPSATTAGATGTAAPASAGVTATAAAGTTSAAATQLAALQPESANVPSGAGGQPAGGTTLLSGEPETGVPQTQITNRMREARKMEILRALYDKHDTTTLRLLESVWNDVLKEIRTNRIATHAWLMAGKPILATPDSVVIAFSSRVHRDAIMKKDDRAAVEAAISTAMNTRMQMLALLQSDWEAFQADVSKAPVERQMDLADKAIELFGEDMVEIQDGVDRS